MILGLSKLAGSLSKAAAAGVSPLPELQPPLPFLAAQSGVRDPYAHGLEGRLARPAVPGNKRSVPRARKTEGPRAYGPRISTVT